MKKRGIVVFGVLLSIMATTFGVVYWRFFYLPHPSVATHEQLMRWVVLRKLDQCDPETRMTLVNRFAGEASDIFGAVPSNYELPEAYSQQLLSNIEVLKRDWFNDRIKQYQKLKDKEREDYLEKQITLMDDLGNLAFENAKILYPEKSDQVLTTISDELLADIDKWLLETPADEKPQTLQAVREATVFWLTTQDLSKQVMAARRELVLRIIAELAAGMDLKTTTSVVSDERQVILRENAVCLMEAWVHTLADEYSNLEAAEKKKYVDEKISNVKKWKLLEFLSPGSSENASALDGITEFNKIFKKWIDQSDEVMKPKLKKIYAAIQQRILFSYLTGSP